MENNVVLTMRDISKTFPGVKALQHVDFTLRKGEIHALMGENGAGKSTLIKVLTGVHPFESGEIKMEGKDAPIVNRSPQDAQDNGISTVYQEVNLCPNLTVAENLFIGREPRKAGLIDWKTMNKKSTELLKDLQIDAKATDKLEECSLAKQQMIAIARAVDMNCRVLILDEPSNDVDIPTVTILEDYLNAFSGIVITVSHDRYFLDNVVDRIFEFDGNGTLRQYEGGYTDYREANERRFGETGAISSVPGGEKEKKERSTGKDWKQNRPTKLKFTYKEQREYETIDDDIAVLEEKIEKLNDDMVKNVTNSGKLAEIMREKEAAEAQLEEKMDRWVYLNDLAEQIEAQKSGN